MIRRYSAPRSQAIDRGDLTWLRCEAALAGTAGRVVLLDRAVALPELLRPVELGPEAHLLAIDRGGRIALGSPTPLPAGLTRLAASGKVAGAQATELGESGAVAGLWPLQSIPWTVVSLQPRAVAEAVASRLRRQSLLGASLALLLALAVSFSAYRSLVRPLRQLLAAQRQLAGEQAEEAEAPDEITALARSLADLAETVQRKAEIGRVFLGRYQVLEVLGAGGMGMVFRGWDPKLQRAVALKTVRLERAPHDQARKRMREALLGEAIATARFNHPHIVAVYDVEDGRDAAYVAMELVEGVNLERHLWARKQLAASEVVPISLAVARGLAAAHEHGLVHRDIKPSNVLLGYDGSIKIADFGLAAFLSSARETADVVFGTPGYLAPEGLRGEAAAPPVDLFALGALIYHCAAGKAPFAARTLREVLVKTLTSRPRRLEKVAQEVPRTLSELVSSLLSREPVARPTAVEAAERLEELARERGWSWHPDLAPTPAPTPPRRSRELAGAWLPTSRLEDHRD